MRPPSFNRTAGIVRRSAKRAGTRTRQRYCSVVSSVQLSFTGQQEEEGGKEGNSS